MTRDYLRSTNQNKKVIMLLPVSESIGPSAIVAPCFMIDTSHLLPLKEIRAFYVYAVTQTKLPRTCTCIHNGCFFACCVAYLGNEQMVKFFAYTLLNIKKRKYSINITTYNSSFLCTCSYRQLFDGFSEQRRNDFEGKMYAD